MITIAHRVPPLTRELKQYRDAAEMQDQIDRLYAASVRRWITLKAVDANTVEAISNLTADLCYSVGVQ